MNRQYSMYPSEGAVVRGQSKVEKAKYVHSENNLRRKLENISESFKRTNKRLSEETEALRSELHKLKESVETIREEKMRRMTGECHKKRRPYQAERFLCDENILTVRPLDDRFTAAKFVCHRKSSKEQRQRRLAPIKLHQNKVKSIDNKEETFVQDKKKEQSKQACQFRLPKIETYLCKNGEPPLTIQKETDATSELQHAEIQEGDFSRKHAHLEVQTIPICDLVDIQAYKEFRENTCMKSKPHFLPPLEKIVEDDV